MKTLMPYLFQAKFESGCVAQVIKTGYALQNRPIRAAKVGVVQ